MIEWPLFGDWNQHHTIISMLSNHCSRIKRKKIKDKSESKFVQISINTSKVKHVKNKSNDEEPLVTDISVTNSPRYFKLFECGKTS